MRSSLILFVFTLLNVLKLSAQKQWIELPNKDLKSSLIRTHKRFEDVFFTSYTTGYAVSLSGKIMKTSNSGKSWFQVSDNTAASATRSIEFLDDKKTGIAGGFGGVVLRTTNAGKTWQNITDSIKDSLNTFGKFAICGMAHYKNIFYGVGWYGSKVAHFYKSIDKGQTWETYYLDTGMVTSLVDVIFINDNIGFASGAKSNSKGGSVILKTLDGGKNWSRVFFDSTIGGIIWKIQKVNAQIFVGSIQPSWGDTIAMVKSIDGGETWEILGTRFNTINFSKSENNVSWTQAIGFINPNRGWIGGYYKGLVETNDGGLTWNYINFGENYNRIFVIDSSHAYAAGRSIYSLEYKTKNNQKHASTQKEDIIIPHKLYPIVPNTSNGNIKIEFNLSTTTNVIVQVINIETKQVWDVHKERMDSGFYTFNWNFEKDAPNGTYIVKLNNDEIAQIQKFNLHR